MLFQDAHCWSARRPAAMGRAVCASVLCLLFAGTSQASAPDCDALTANAPVAQTPVRLTLSDGHSFEVARFGQASATARYAIEVNTPRGCLIAWQFVRVAQYDALVGEWKLTLTNDRTLTSPRVDRADQAMWLSDGDRRWHFVPPASAFDAPSWDRQKFWITTTDKPNNEVAVVPGLIAGLDRKSTRLNSSHIPLSRMPSSA